MRRIGLIVNPIAGMGGPAGMKGSDRPEAVRRAIELGIEPRSQRRTTEVLERVRAQWDGAVEILAAPGPMGEIAAQDAGCEPVVCGSCGNATTAADTERIAGQLAATGIDLLVFSGGDGTARNICRAVGTDLPCLGIPTGVKMHSGVFALHPAAAASVIVSLLRGTDLRYHQEEVVDLDEEQYIRGNVGTKLYGYLTVPALKNCMQGMKAGRQPSDDQAAGEIGAQMARRILAEKDLYFALGAGTTTMAIKKALGLSAGTLLGVDVCRGSECVQRDANGPELEKITTDHPMKIVISPIGGQGYLFGRGNQQFTPQVLKAVGRNNIIVVCPPHKIDELGQRPFLVDTGEVELDQMLRGYTRVLIGLDTEIVRNIV